MIILSKSKRKRKLKKLEDRVTDLESRLVEMEKGQKKKRIAREWLELIPIAIRQIFKTF